MPQVLHTSPGAANKHLAHADLILPLVSLEAILSSLGQQLMLLPDSPEADDLTCLYHSVCDRLHAAAIAEEQLRP